MQVSLHISLLYDVFGFAIISQNTSRYAVQTLVVTTHQDFKNRRISRTHPFDDLFVGKGLGSKGFHLVYGFVGHLLPLLLESRQDWKRCKHFQEFVCNETPPVSLF